MAKNTGACCRAKTGLSRMPSAAPRSTQPSYRRAILCSAPHAATMRTAANASAAAALARTSQACTALTARTSSGVVAA